MEISKARFALSHEIGHWLGLYHIWGKNGCKKGIDDGISDTPRQNHSHEINEENNVLVVQKTCDNPNILSNYQNFMDYSFSGGMFTKQQKNVMRSTLLSKRLQITEGFMNNTTISSPNETNSFTKKEEITFNEFNTYVLSATKLDYENNDEYLDKYVKTGNNFLFRLGRNEFEQRKNKTRLKESLREKIKKFDYGKRYQKTFYFKLDRYSFKMKKFDLNYLMDYITWEHIVFLNL